MLLDDKQIEQLDKLVLSWNKTGIKKGGLLKDVSTIFEDIVKLTKQSDEYGLDEITFVLLFLAHSINNGQDDVQCLCDLIYNSYDDMYGTGKKVPGEGETGMVHEDGTFVTLKELGIE